MKNMYNHPATSNRFGLPRADNGLIFTYDMECVYFIFLEFKPLVGRNICFFVIANTKFIWDRRVITSSVSEGTNDLHSNRQSIVMYICHVCDRILEILCSLLGTQ